MLSPEFTQCSTAALQAQCHSSGIFQQGAGSRWEQSRAKPCCPPPSHFPRWAFVPAPLSEVVAGEIDTAQLFPVLPSTSPRGWERPWLGERPLSAEPHLSQDSRSLTPPSIPTFISARQDIPTSKSRPGQAPGLHQPGSCTETYRGCTEYSQGLTALQQSRPPLAVTDDTSPHILLPHSFYELHLEFISL